MKIYSKIEPGKLLHMVVRKVEIKEGRTNLCPDEQFLQCAALRLKAGDTFKAHKHNWNACRVMEDIHQESWVIISGSVKVFFYDLDDTIIYMAWLYAGDISFTFEGGHNYEILEQNTSVYEFKTGPYYGQGHDKTFLNEI